MHIRHNAQVGPPHQIAYLRKKRHNVKHNFIHCLLINGTTYKADDHKNYHFKETTRFLAMLCEKTGVDSSRF